MDNVSNIFGGELSQDYGDANFTIGRSHVYYDANGAVSYTHLTLQTKA